MVHVERMSEETAPVRAMKMRVVGTRKRRRRRDGKKL